MSITPEDYWNVVARARAAEAENQRMRDALVEMDTRIRELSDQCGERIVRMAADLAMLELRLMVAVDRARAMKYIMSTN